MAGRGASRAQGGTYRGETRRVIAQTGDILSLRHGTGSYTYKNRFFTYSGEWVNGVKHGQGRLDMADGSWFHGTFVKGEIVGYGTRKYSDGSKASGEFLYGDLHGPATRAYADGSLYKGNFEHNKRQGQGVLTLKDGTVFEGDFSDNHLDGQGVQTSPGRLYVGQWQRSKRHGTGNLQLELPDGVTAVHDGLWLDDVPHGVGTLSLRIPPTASIAVKSPSDVVELLDEGIAYQFHGMFEKGGADIASHMVALLSIEDSAAYVLEQQKGKTKAKSKRQSDKSVEDTPASSALVTMPSGGLSLSGGRFPASSILRLVASEPPQAPAGEEELQAVALSVGRLAPVAGEAGRILRLSIEAVDAEQADKAYFCTCATLPDTPIEEDENKTSSKAKKEKAAGKAAVEYACRGACTQITGRTTDRAVTYRVCDGGVLQLGDIAFSLDSAEGPFAVTIKDVTPGLNMAASGETWLSPLLKRCVNTETITVKLPNFSGQKKKAKK